MTRSIPFIALTLLSLTFLLTSCKTQEEIRREQMVQNISKQMRQNQEISADAQVRMQEIEERINELQGELEEKGYKQEQEQKSTISGLRDRVSLVEEEQKSINKKLDEIENQLANQKDYLDRVLDTLKKMSSQKKKPTKELYGQALKHYRNAQYKKARPIFQELLDRDIKGKTLAHTYHNLAMIDYMANRNQSALVKFSKLFTEFPDSVYNKNGLLFLAKTFLRQDKKNEAKQALEQLINRFPDAKQVSRAKKMLKNLEG